MTTTQALEMMIAAGCSLACKAHVARVIANGMQADAHFDSTASYSIEIGRVWVRVVRTEFGSRSAHAFVRITDGEARKVHNWKAPSATVLIRGVAA